MKKTTHLSTSEFLDRNKRFYLEEEDEKTNDFVAIADRFVGLETFFHRWRAAVIHNLLRKFNTGGGLCLDVGCGTGLNLRNLPKESIGIDLNPRNLLSAKLYAPNAFVVQADMEYLPFKSNTFAIVLCAEVLEHVPNPELTLRQIWRVLKPKGILIGTVPSDSLIWKLRFLSNHQGREPYHKHYTLEEFLRVISLLSLSFHVVSCRYVVPTPIRHLSMNVVFVLQKL